MIIASLEDASSSSVRRALFRKVHCLQIPIPSAEDGLASYRDAPCHALIWHTDTAAGLRMAESSSEIVIQTERPQLGANLTVRRGPWSARPLAQRLRMLRPLARERNHRGRHQPGRAWLAGVCVVRRLATSRLVPRRTRRTRSATRSGIARCSMVI